MNQLKLGSAPSVAEVKIQALGLSLEAGLLKEALEPLEAICASSKGFDASSGHASTLWGDEIVRASGPVASFKAKAVESVLGPKVLAMSRGA